MIVRSLSGEEIDSALMLAMRATVDQMKQYGLVTRDQAEHFLDEHLCLYVAGGGPFKSWFKRLWWTDGTDSQGRIAIARVPVKPPKKPPK